MPERTRTRIDEVRLHALHAGRGRPLVLLHGLAGSHRWWRYNVPALAREHRVHVPEMVGFGSSRGTDGYPDIQGMAGLMLRWLDAMEVERTDFVGHSMGAQVAIHLAARHPHRIRRLVLVSAAGVPRWLSASRVAALAGELVWPRAWGKFGFLRTIAADAVRAGPRTLLHATYHILADDIRPLLPRIRMPTLLLWGAHDPLTPPQDGRLMQELLPQARLVVFPHASHNPMADRPADFNSELLRFLRETDDEVHG